MSIGERIAGRRKQLNMSQDMLAELLYISRPTLSDYENSKREISAGMLISIAEALETKVGYLVGEAATPEQNDEVQALLKIYLSLKPELREVAIRQMKVLKDID